MEVVPLADGFWFPKTALNGFKAFKIRWNTLFIGLSRRKPGFNSPWDYQSIKTSVSISLLTPVSLLRKLFPQHYPQQAGEK
jgi:hypothetical protein